MSRRTGWYDSTSYSQSDRVRAPRCWTLEWWDAPAERFPRASLTVARTLSGDWAVTARIDGAYRELGSVSPVLDAAGARAAAVQRLRDYAETFAATAAHLAALGEAT